MYMKYHLPVLTLIILMIACSREKGTADPKTEEIYQELDAEIERSAEYEAPKENRILALRKELASTRDESRRTELLNRLAEEYNAYDADSALYYVSLNLNRKVIADDPKMRRRLLIKRADILAHAGLFSDAQAVLSSISSGEVEDDLKEEYYATYCALYQYLSEYNSEHETAGKYEEQRALYADSVNMVVEPDSFNHMVYVMSQTAREGHPDKAISTLEKNLRDYPSGTREYSILASTLAYIYKISGRRDEYKRYLALSAISDIKGAVKENMSFREAATVMMEDGDVERANLYIKKSITDANFYSGMLRNVQSSKLLPMIDEAYSSRQHKLMRRMRILTWLSFGLSVVLLITIGFILKQFKSLHRANARVNAANNELSRLSDDLAARNSVLNEYNRTKEQYAGLFMENCASAISTLLQYQKSLRILAAQGARAALVKKLESNEMADKMLKNFYVNFDEAILNIYPDFIEKFNALLNPGEEITLKNGEIMNTELRLYALIRLGIDDSGKIADFLRCSISTVYTYRSKMKKRARKPDTFEADVRALC